MASDEVCPEEYLTEMLWHREKATASILYHTHTHPAKELIIIIVIVIVVRPHLSSRNMNVSTLDCYLHLSIRFPPILCDPFFGRQMVASRFIILKWSIRCRRLFDAKHFSRKQSLQAQCHFLLINILLCENDLTVNAIINQKGHTTITATISTL